MKKPHFQNLRFKKVRSLFILFHLLFFGTFQAKPVLLVWLIFNSEIINIPLIFFQEYHKKFSDAKSTNFSVNLQKGVWKTYTTRK